MRFWLASAAVAGAFVLPEGFSAPLAGPCSAVPRSSPQSYGCMIELHTTCCRRQTRLGEIHPQDRRKVHAGSPDMAWHPVQRNLVALSRVRHPLGIMTYRLII